MARPTVKTLFQVIIPLMISAGLCYILYSGMEWSDVRAGLATCRWEWIAAWAAVNVAALACRGARWRMQLRSIGIEAPQRVMFWSMLGTYAVNLVFPRLGEVWRCGYVAKRQKARFTPVFGSMVADRLTDTLCVLLITALAAVVARGPMARFMTETGFGQKVTAALTSPWAMAAAAVMAAVILLLVLFPSAKAVSRFKAMMANVWSGFASIFHIRHTWLWLMLSAGVWLCYFTGTWFTFMAFDSTASLLAADGLVAVLVTFVFGSWAMAVPSNGGIGPWQMAVMLALSGIYGMASGPALAFATIVMALQTLLSVLLGLYAFLRIAIDRKAY